MLAGDAVSTGAFIVQATRETVQVSGALGNSKAQAGHTSAGWATFRVVDTRVSSTGAQLSKQ